MDEGELVTGLPSVGDFINVDVTDSRFNLVVGQSPDCYPSGDVTICQYVIVHSDLTVVAREVICSSALPEYIATPK